MIRKLKRIYGSIRFNLWLCWTIAKLISNCETVSIREIDDKETAVHFFSEEINQLGLVDLQKLLE